jgi:arylsulfatase
MQWVNPFTPLRAPELVNLRTDPYERADITSNTYWEWMLDRALLVIYGQAIASQFLETFKEFPPRQKAATFTADQALKELETFLEI